MVELLDLVRLGLGLDPLSEVRPASRQIVELAWMHGVGPQLVAAVEEVGADTDAQIRLSELRRAETLLGLRSAAGLVRVVNTLAEASVPHLAFKGVALGALTGRAPSQRFGVDHDILICPEHHIPALEAFESVGFQPAVGSYPPVGDDPRTRFLTWSGCERPLVADAIHVDLHWRLFPGHPPRLMSRELLGRAVEVEVAGVAMPTLDADAALAHLVVNGAKDHWSRLRAIVDIHLLEVAAGADWGRARSLLPRSVAWDEAREGVDFLRGAKTATVHQASNGALTMWLDGVNGRLVFDEKGRPPRGWVRYLRRLIALTPGRGTTAAVICNFLVPPASLADSRLPPRWWWLSALGHRPVKIVRLVLFGKRRPAPA